MNNTGAVLEELAEVARKDKWIKQRFLDSRESEDPYREFCKVAKDLGYDLTVMDIQKNNSSDCSKKASTAEAPITAFWKGRMTSSHSFLMR